MIVNIGTFFEQILNTLEKTLISGERLPSRLLSFILNVLREFKKDKCLIRASSLSYTSLLALIPLTALSFSLFTAFDAFSGIKDSVHKWIITILIPTRQNEFLVYIDQFLNNSKTLGIIGLLLFAITSIMLLNRISESFNWIWGSKNKRNFIGKFTSYTSVLVFGTLFIGTSFTMSAPIQKFLESVPNIQFIIRWLVELSPSIFIFFTFFLMITAIPAGKVRLKSSLLGSLSGTILWEIARKTFNEGTSYVIRMSRIYGSIAAIPIFLFWLYLIWIIIFLALEITYVHQHTLNYGNEFTLANPKPAIKIKIGLAVFQLIADKFNTGKEYYSTSQISNILSVPESLIAKMVQSFVHSGLVLETDETIRRLLPSKSLNRIFMKHVMEAILGDEELFKKNTNVSNTTKMFLSAGYNSLGTITAEDFCKQSKQELE